MLVGSLVHSLLSEASEQGGLIGSNYLLKELEFREADPEIKMLAKHIIARIGPIDFSRTIAEEHRFTCYRGEELLSGIIDRLDRDRLGVRIVEYKTGMVLKDLENNAQTLVYLSYIKEQYPNTPISMTYHFLSVDEKKTIKYSSEIETKLLELLTKYRQIELRKQKSPKLNCYCISCFKED